MATVGYGTALGVVRAAIEAGKRVKVIATETRPASQGAKLTCYELKRDGIDVSLIVDTAVGYVMDRGMVDLVLVGADRVLSTGHVFNKIGTYQIAVLANRHNIPFYAAAPSSSFDLGSKPDDVVIEMRSDREVTYVRGKRISPRGIKAINPVFDRTPPELVSAIITERGVMRPPYNRSIPELIG